MTEVISTAPKTEKNIKDREDFMIRPASVRLFEHSNNSWCCTAPRGAIPKDLEMPKLWWAVLQDLKPYDKIMVLDSEESWLANLLVIDPSPSFTRIKLLTVVDLLPEDAKEPI
jgi:hypothetical protein